MEKAVGEISRTGVDSKMTEEKIRVVVEKFAEESQKIYGVKLQGLILYGSCARGDLEEDIDIDILVLLDVPADEINRERKRILDVSDRLDLDYDVVLAPVFQNYQLYEKYRAVSIFYQNIQKERVRIA